MANSVAATTAAKNLGGGGATGPLTRSFRGFFHLTGGTGPEDNSGKKGATDGGERVCVEG
ncbi:hypothetical protein PG984_000862 [Apiospora sp. TS-2023a]